MYTGFSEGWDLRMCHRREAYRRTRLSNSWEFPPHLSGGASGRIPLCAFPYGVGYLARGRGANLNGDASMEAGIIAHR